MSYTYKKQLAHSSNYGGTRSASDIKYLAIHFTANDGDSDEANAKYFQTAGRNASAHYFVDDDSVTQSVCDLNIAWAVGGSKYADCSQTGGGKLYKIATNANSLSVELCDTVKDGKYAPSPATLENAIALCRELMKKYNIDIDHVIRHFDVTGKKCPVYYVDEKAWAGFKALLSQNKPTTATTSAPKTEKDQSKGTKYRVTAPAGLNIRAGAGTKYKKLYALAEGDVFTVDRFEGEWAHGCDNLNREGFAFGKWLALSE